MAGSSSNALGSKNPFLDDDEDVSDMTFLGRSGPRAYEASSIAERREQLLAQRRQIEERTIQSSMRSVGLLQEAEDVGIATAEELNRQREVLENTDHKLNDINSALRASDKHIQGIKSVFGSLKNYFSGRNSAAAKAPTSSASTSEKTDSVPKSKSNLAQILENGKDTASHDVNDHPALRLRSESVPLDVDAILDKNLEDMGSALSRLKSLGISMQEELEDHDKLIDRITTKTGDADWRIKHQNKEMDRILKK